MPKLSVHPDRLDIKLTAAEKVLAFRTHDLSFERGNIRSATITEDPWIWVRGIRAPGTAIPLTVAAGTWKYHGGKDFLLIKRTALAVVVDLVDEEYSRVVITTKHAPELIAALQLGTPTSSIPVVEEHERVVTAAENRDAEGTVEPVAEATEAAAGEAAAAEPEAAVTETAEPVVAEPVPVEAAEAAPAASDGSPSASEPPAEKPTPVRKPRAARKPKTDQGAGHASEEPSGGTEAAE
jgi:hypothetical protein